MGYLVPLDPIDGRRRLRVSSPVDGHTVGDITVANEADVRAAVARARAAQPGWAKVPVKERARLVLRAVDVLVRDREAYMATMAEETGRVRLDTLMIELFAALDILNYHGRNAPKVLGDRRVGLHLLRHKKARIVYQPLGVVGVISPWNGPFVLSLNPAVQAVLAGNTVVIKPSEVTPFSGLLVDRLFRDAGFPEDVLQVVTGDGETGAALVGAGVDKVSFTGSVATGRKIGEACGRALVPCTLELGGKDPMIVCADADLDRAAGGAVFGAMMNAGQFCASTERVYVLREVADAFTAKVVDKVRQLEPGRDLGPFIFERQADIVDRQVQEAIALGARVLAGGSRWRNGYEPTVLASVTHAMSIMRDETFGPVLPIAVVDDEAEAIRLANDSEYGLAASVWTKSAARADRLARQLHAGSVTVNESSITYGALEVPFGGRRNSGVGRVNGVDALLSFCHPMPIVSDRFGTKEESVWYPYTEDKVRSLEKAIDVIWGTPLRWFLS